MLTKKTRKTVIALTISLCALVITSLIVALLYQQNKSELDLRTQLTKTLAMQLSAFYGRSERQLIYKSIDQLVQHNTEVLSAALRDPAGFIVHEAGSHTERWQPEGDTKTTALQKRHPVMANGQTKGFVEIRFRYAQKANLAELMARYGWILILFSAAIPLAWLGLSINQQDQLLGIIPRRVRESFNSLREGALLLNKAGEIVFANHTFLEQTGLDAETLIGLKASELGWRAATLQQLESEWEYPWVEAQKTGNTLTNIRVKLEGKNDKTFNINCTPISDPNEPCIGVLVITADITQEEQKDRELQSLHQKFIDTQNKLKRQEKRIRMLTEQDHLTGCLNHESYQKRLTYLFNNAQMRRGKLACLLVDVDQLKSFNKINGRNKGDQIIKLVSAICREHLRDTDIIGRFSSKGFSIALDDTGMEQARKLAEQIRTSVMDSTRYRIGLNQPVTVSIGIAAMTRRLKSAADMLRHAEQALQTAKNNGRNHIIYFDETLGHALPTLSTDSAKQLNGTKPLSKGRLEARVRELEQLTSEQSKMLQRNLNYDSLTGLPNRPMLYTKLTQHLACSMLTKRPIAVISITAATYNRVDETLGHAASDQMVIAIAKILRDLTNAHHPKCQAGRTDDIQDNDSPILARLSGDDFCLVIPEIRDQSTVVTLVNTIYETLSQPLSIVDLELQLKPSIGISIYPGDGKDTQTLIKHAGAARQVASQTPGDYHCQFYLDGLNKDAANHLQIESELLHALKYQEFELYYQPIVQTQQTDNIAMEVLLRWIRPGRETISSELIIEIAEKNQLIMQIGDWVLKTAIGQLAQWHQEFSANLRLSINLSPSQLLQPDLADRVIGYLRENQVEPCAIQLEITETTLIKNLDESTALCKKLREAGIQILMDDFGTGYSSLQYLQDIPVDAIKIDRSFVQKITDDQSDLTIISAIIALAQCLNLSIVAEGVETDRQFRILRDLGCHEIQGYLFGQPVSADSAERMIRERLEEQPGGNKVWMLP